MTPQMSGSHAPPIQLRCKNPPFCTRTVPKPQLGCKNGPFCTRTRLKPQLRCKTGPFCTRLSDDGKKRHAPPHIQKGVPLRRRGPPRPREEGGARWIRVLVKRGRSRQWEGTKWSTKCAMKPSGGVQPFCCGARVSGRVRGGRRGSGQGWRSRCDIPDSGGGWCRGRCEQNR